VDEFFLCSVPQSIAVVSPVPTLSKRQVIANLMKSIPMTISESERRDGVWPSGKLMAYRILDLVKVK
jgi:hypothetical protein